MSDDVLIGVENVSKKFCRNLKQSLWYGVQDSVADIFCRQGGFGKLRAEEFWAVEGASFELRRGESLGLIGRNGAGKTTLLKMLTGLIKPDRGRIELRGRVGALIALGAGFNPILSGRENIYINGSVLGLNKCELDTKIEDIIDFAEIGEFIDSPVQSYSSGMQVRLGFAVATALEVDVLLLDEVLAVGDANFRHKCYSRIDRLRKHSAVIFVSHSMEDVAHFCSQVLWMSHGKAQLFQDKMEGIRAYNADNVSNDSSAVRGLHATYPPVKSAQLNLGTPTVATGGAVRVCVKLELDECLEEAIASFIIRDITDQAVYCWHSSQFDETICLPEGRSSFEFLLDPVLLAAGKYQCSFFLCPRNSLDHCIWLWNVYDLVVTSDRQPIGNVMALAPYNGHWVRKIEE